MDKVKDTVKGLGDKVKEAASKVKGWIGEAKDKAVGAAKKIGNAIMSLFGGGNKDSGQKAEESSAGPAARLEADGRAQDKAAE